MAELAEQPKAAAAPPHRQAGRSVRHGDFRGGGRSDRAHVDSGALQPCPRRICFPKNSRCWASRARNCQMTTSASAYMTTSRPTAANAWTTNVWEWFSQRFYYIAGDFNDDKPLLEAQRLRLRRSIRTIRPTRTSSTTWRWPRLFWSDRRKAFRHWVDGTEQQSLAPRGHRKTFRTRSGISQGS